MALSSPGIAFGLSETFVVGLLWNLASVAARPASLPSLLQMWNGRVLPNNYLEHFSICFTESPIYDPHSQEPIMYIVLFSDLPNSFSWDLLWYSHSLMSICVLGKWSKILIKTTLTTNLSILSQQTFKNTMASSIVEVVKAQIYLYTADYIVNQNNSWEK